MIYINIRTIPHKHQRYPTVGDWQWRNKDLYICVSNMDDEDKEFLVAMHEQIEAYLCYRRGIKQEDVDNFDIEYEARRQEEDVTEPGDSEMAPYNKEHVFATKLEKLLAEELRVDWKLYEETINNL